MPLAYERYDLVIPRLHYEGALLRLLAPASFRLVRNVAVSSLGALRGRRSAAAKT